MIRVKPFDGGDQRVVSKLTFICPNSQVASAHPANWKLWPAHSLAVGLALRESQGANQATERYLGYRVEIHQHSSFAAHLFAGPLQPCFSAEAEGAG